MFMTGSEQEPPLDFMTFVLSLKASCLVHLGLVSVPGEASDVNIALAKHTLELLVLLDNKTEGNLTGEEERALSAMISELREAYNSVTSKEK